MCAKTPQHKSESFAVRIIYYAWHVLYQFIRFAIAEFKHFFSRPKLDLSQNFWLTTRLHINGMGLWCAVGIALIYLTYDVIVISVFGNIPNFDVRIEGDGIFIAIKNFTYRFAHQLQLFGFYLVDTVLFTLFLMFWLYKHYSQRRLSKKATLYFSIIYVFANNIEGITSTSSSLSNIWLIMTPIIIIPAVGNRQSLPLLVLNILMHHLLTSYEPYPYDFLTSIASFFVAIFIMMMQIEYYRREARLHQSATRLRERALEIELIKEHMNSGLMLLSTDLKVRPNYSDLCVKLLHKKDLHDKYFPSLLRSILEENQFFIHSMSYSSDPEGGDYEIKDLGEWEARIKHYFEMIQTGHLDDDELSLIDPLQYIKIYSYEGRSYISFRVSAIKVQEKIKYFMVLISNDTGRVAGRYRLMERERSQLERARLLFTLSHVNPVQQLQQFKKFAECYLKLCKNVLTEIRSTMPPQQLVDQVHNELATLQNIFQDLNLQQYIPSIADLQNKCEMFNKVELKHGNVMIINKSAYAQYMQLIMDCERFLRELRFLFNMATFFIREPNLADELQRQKHALHYGLSQDTLQSASHDDFVIDTQCNPQSQMFINLYAAFEILLSQYDLQQNLNYVEQKFSVSQAHQAISP